jgi:hypothetical protein
MLGMLSLFYCVCVASVSIGNALVVSVIESCVTPIALSADKLSISAAAFSELEQLLRLNTATKASPKCNMFFMGIL